MNIQKELKDIRLQRGLSVRKLAEMAGTTAAAISNIETGKRKPQIDTVERICDALGATLKIEKNDSTTNDSQ